MNGDRNGTGGRVCRGRIGPQPRAPRSMSVAPKESPAQFRHNFSAFRILPRLAGHHKEPTVAAIDGRARVAPVSPNFPR
jgi:hypothetical protein